MYTAYEKYETTIVTSLKILLTTTKTETETKSPTLTTETDMKYFVHIRRHFGAFRSV